MKRLFLALAIVLLAVTTTPVSAQAPLLLFENRELYVPTVPSIAPTLGSELVANGGMELDSNWANIGSPTLNERSSEQVHSGVYSRKFTTDSANEGIKQASMSAPSGYFCKRVMWLYATAPGANLAYGWDGIYGTAYTTDSAWSKTERVNLASGAASDFMIYDSGRFFSTWYADDVSVKAISETFGTIYTAAPNGSFYATLPVTPAPYQGGFAFCISPDRLSYLQVWQDGTNVKFAKWVNGTYTGLISAASAWGASKQLLAVKNGISVSIYYGGVQVGTTQAVDAVFDNYAGFAAFATDATVQLTGLGWRP